MLYVYRFVASIVARALDETPYDDFDLYLPRNPRCRTWIERTRSSNSLLLTEVLGSQSCSTVVNMADLRVPCLMHVVRRICLTGCGV